MKIYSIITGGYSSPENQPEVASLSFNGTALQVVDQCGAWKNPSYLLYENGKIYAALEWEAGATLGILPVDRQGRFGAPKMISVPGKGVCHVAKAGEYLYLSGYGGGALTGCTESGEVCAYIQRQGSGTNPQRQEAPHIHSCLPSPCGKFLFAADLGTDSILKYRLNQEDGSLCPAAEQPTLQTPAGAGPRHFAFAPAHNTLYVACELSNELLVYRYHPETMACTLLESHAMAQPGAENIYAADIHLAPCGDMLYTCVRGSDLLHRYSVLPGGKLEPAGKFSSGGKGPRNFALSPDGRFLAAANMGSGNLVIFRLGDEAPGVVAEFLQPGISCVQWAECGLHKQEKTSNTSFKYIAPIHNPACIWRRERCQMKFERMRNYGKRLFHPNRTCRWGKPGRSGRGGLLLRAMAAGLVLSMVFYALPFFFSCDAISREVLRLHVLANSDTEADQALKLKVRDAVLTEAAKWYGDAKTFEEANTAVCTHLQSIQAAAQAAVAANGSAQQVAAEVTDVYFTTRDYADFSLPAGKYRTLRITLGAGKGKNWWCMVYPALCLPAAEKQEENSDILKRMPEQESKIIENPGEYRVEFKVVEWYQELVKLFDK